MLCQPWLLKEYILFYYNKRLNCKVLRTYSSCCWPQISGVEHLRDRLKERRQCQYFQCWFLKPVHLIPKCLFRHLSRHRGGGQRRMKRREYSAFDIFIQGKKLKKSELPPPKLTVPSDCSTCKGNCPSSCKGLLLPFFFQPCPFHFIQDLFALSCC